MALAALAIVPFRVVETGPCVPQRDPQDTRLATLAQANRITVDVLVESLRAETAAGRLRWDADALLAVSLVQPDLNLVLIDDVLRVYPHRYVSDTRCVAKTSAGKRCRNTLSYSQPAPWSVWALPGEQTAFVQGFDLDGPDVFAGKDGTVEAMKQRFLTQRCLLHRDAPEDATTPEWQLFDLQAHRPHLWVLDGTRLTDANILPLHWPAEVPRSNGYRRDRDRGTMKCPL